MDSSSLATVGMIVALFVIMFGFFYVVLSVLMGVPFKLLMMLRWFGRIILKRR